MQIMAEHDNRRLSRGVPPGVSMMVMNDGMFTVRNLRVLVIHNRYRWRGGEDVQVDREVAAFRRLGSQVRVFEVSSSEIKTDREFLRGWTGLSNRRRSKGVLNVVDEFKPDLVHIHNTFPFLTPSVIETVAEHHRTVVVSLHNYRVFCANGLCLRDGRQCTRCASDFLPRAVIHRCYRGSPALSAAVWAVGLRLRRALRHPNVRLVAPSRFAARTLSTALRIDIGVVPNILPAPCVVERKAGQYVLFVGRLSEEKGVQDLLAAWATLSKRFDVELVIVGDGSMRGSLVRMVSRESIEGVRFVGPADQAETAHWMRSARLCVVPSRFPETFGLVAAEAAAHGCGVVVSDAGALLETVGGDGCAWVYTAGDVAALRTTLKEALENPSEVSRRAEAAQRYVMSHYSERAVLAEIVASAGLWSGQVEDFCDFGSGR